jgi:hypothetical protein
MRITRSVHVSAQIRATVRSRRCHGQDQCVIGVVQQCEYFERRCPAQWWPTNAQLGARFLAATVRAGRPGLPLHWRQCRRCWVARSTRGPYHEPAARRSAGALREGMTSHSSLNGDDMGMCLCWQKKPVLAKKPFPSLTSSDNAPPDLLVMGQRGHTCPCFFQLREAGRNGRVLVSLFLALRTQLLILHLQLGQLL